jgi:hypothetical protein
MFVVKVKNGFRKKMDDQEKNLDPSFVISVFSNSSTISSTKKRTGMWISSRK